MSQWPRDFSEGSLSSSYAVRVILTASSASPGASSDNPLYVTGSLGTQLSFSGTIQIPGTITVSNFPAVQTVTGSVSLSQAPVIRYGDSIKSIPLYLSSSGDNLVIAPVSGMKIKVMLFVVQASGTLVNVDIRDQASSASLAGPFALGNREGISLGLPKPSFLFATSTTSGLIINLSNAARVTGFLTYFDDES